MSASATRSRLAAIASRAETSSKSGSGRPSSRTCPELSTRVDTMWPPPVEEARSFPLRMKGKRWRLRFQVVRMARQPLTAILRDEHEVLEPDAAEALAVRARLDREDVAGDERVACRPRRGSAARAPRARRRARVRGRSPRRAARPPACRASVGWPCARKSSPVARCSECADTPARMSAMTCSSTSRVSRCHSRELGGDVADDERPRHVREAAGLAVARRQVDDHGLAALDLPGPELVADRRLRAVGDDRDVGRAVVLGHGPLDRGPQLLAGRRHLRAGSSARRPSRVRGGLRAADPRELGLVLHAAPGVEELAVGASAGGRARGAGRRARAGTTTGRPRPRSPTPPRRGSPARAGSRRTAGRCESARRGRTPPARAARRRGGPSARPRSGG